MSCATAIEETLLHALVAGTLSKMTVPVGIEVGSVAIEALPRRDRPRLASAPRPSQHNRAARKSHRTLREGQHLARRAVRRPRGSRAASGACALPRRLTTFPVP